LGFDFVATGGTCRQLERSGIPSRLVKKIGEGRPNVIDYIKNGEIQLVINTPSGKESAEGSRMIRRTVLTYGLPYATTLAGACAVASGIEALRKKRLTVRSVQHYYHGHGHAIPQRSEEAPERNKGVVTPTLRKVG
jgi:carbamoyl-phosphate synthase large subunit